MHLAFTGRVVPRLEMYAHPPKFYGGLRFQPTGRLAIERNLLFLRQLQVSLTGISLESLKWFDSPLIFDGSNLVSHYLTYFWDATQIVVSKLRVRLKMKGAFSG